jgi:hypothetical protein
MTASVIHFAAVPFRPSCGADVANQRTTDNRDLASCAACFREELKGAEGAIARFTDSEQVLLKRANLAEAKLVGAEGAVARAENANAPLVARLAVLEPVVTALFRDAHFTRVGCFNCHRTLLDHKGRPRKSEGPCDCGQLRETLLALVAASDQPAFGQRLAAKL